MSKLIRAPRACLLLCIGLVGGCGNLSADAWRIDAADRTPIVTTDREPTCAVASPSPVVSAAPAAPSLMAATASLASAPAASGRIASPIAPFFLRRPPAMAATSTSLSAPFAATASLATRGSESLADAVDRGTSDVPGGMRTLPDRLQNDKVMKSMLDLVVRRKQQMLKSTIDSSSDASLRSTLAMTVSVEPGGGGATALSKTALAQAAGDAADKHKPEPISIDDIKNLHQNLVAHRLERGMNYVSYYFDGKMVDRLGNKLAAPTFTDMKVTNADITGLLVALLESAADEALQTPVWIGATADDKNYYPGGSTNVPSALRYAAGDKEADFPKYAEKLVAKGCGMTKLKSQAARYLANDAAVWAGSGTGLVMGLFGGVEVGPFVAFGKVSIGDNQTLQAIVQALITFAARRGTYEAIWPRLYAYNETENDRLATLVAVLKFVAPADTAAAK